MFEASEKTVYVKLPFILESNIELGVRGKYLIAQATFGRQAFFSLAPDSVKLHF